MIKTFGPEARSLSGALMSPFESLFSKPNTIEYNIIQYNHYARSGEIVPSQEKQHLMLKRATTLTAAATSMMIS